MAKKTIVISAVNLVEAGTLAILRDCLQFLSKFAENNEYQIIAIVFKKELANFPNIEYIETQWPKKSWVNRIWFEYVSLRKISNQLEPVYLWFSLHDTTPSVIANRRAVYCHNSYSFYKWRLHDLIFAPKIAFFAIFTKFIYKTNISKNKYLVVQQEWFRQSLSKMLNYDNKRIIVANPSKKEFQPLNSENLFDQYSFVFAGSPNSHKNFEVICKAAQLLERKGIFKFKVLITVLGEENKYANWLYRNWGHLETVNFIGFQPQKDVFEIYKKSHCLIFPSKIESWGLPISEFTLFNKPMLLADLPYAHETAAGAKLVSYFNPKSAEDLAQKMEDLINGNTSILNAQPKIKYDEPVAKDWEELFEILLKSN